MKFEDLLITPNQYLGGKRQAKRYLANPAATAFQSGNMLYNAAGPGYNVEGGFDVDGDTAQEIYDQTVNNSGPIRARDPNDLTVQVPDSSNGNGSSGGSNGNQGSGGSNGNGSGNNSGSNGNKDSGGPTLTPVQGNPVTFGPAKDPADQKDSKPERDTGQDQDQKPDSSQYLYWAIPAVSIGIAIAVYIYGNS